MTSLKQITIKTNHENNVRSLKKSWSWCKKEGRKLKSNPEENNVYKIQFTFERCSME